MSNPDDLYFIRVENGPVKIGRSNNAKKRLCYFQVGCPYELALVGVISGGGEHEVWFHANLDCDRLRGEWFAWTPAVAAKVKAALSGDHWQVAVGMETDEDWRIGSPLYAGDPKYPQYQVRQ